MSDTVIEAKPANPKADEWAERIAAQQRSGMSVKQFCQERGLTECSFYAWRKRLQEGGPVHFALVERSRPRQRTVEAALELVLATASACASAPGRNGPQGRMIHLPASVYLCLTPCDMRKSGPGLMSERKGAHALSRRRRDGD